MIALRGLSQLYPPNVLDKAVENIAAAVRRGPAAFTSDEIQQLEDAGRFTDERERWKAIGGFLDARLMREIESLVRKRKRRG